MQRMFQVDCSLENAEFADCVLAGRPWISTGPRRFLRLQLFQLFSGPTSLLIDAAHVSSGLQLGKRRVRRLRAGWTTVDFHRPSPLSAVATLSALFGSNIAFNRCSACFKWIAAWKTQSSQIAWWLDDRGFPQALAAFCGCNSFSSFRVQHRF